MNWLISVIFTLTFSNAALAGGDLTIEKSLKQNPIVIQLKKGVEQKENMICGELRDVKVFTDHSYGYPRSVFTAKVVCGTPEGTPWNEEAAVFILFSGSAADSGAYIEKIEFDFAG